MVSQLSDRKIKPYVCSIVPAEDSLSAPSVFAPCVLDDTGTDSAAFNKYQQTPQTPLAQTLFTEPEPYATFSDEERAMLLSVAQKWNGYTNIQYERGACSNKAIDCSNLVAKIYAEAGFPYPYTPSGGDWQAAGFEKIDLAEAKPGDVIRWNGHVGIVMDPVNRTFLAISSTATSDPIRISSFGEATDWGNKPFDILQFQKASA